MLGRECERGEVPVLADVAIFKAEAGLPVCTLLLGEAEVDEDAASFFVVVEEVGGFDISVEDAGAVDGVEGGEERVEVITHLEDEEVAVVEAEVKVAEIRENSYDLVMMSEGREQRADVRGGAESMENFELVLNAMR